MQVFQGGKIACKKGTQVFVAVVNSQNLKSYCILDALAKSVRAFLVPVKSFDYYMWD